MKVVSKPSLFRGYVNFGWGIPIQNHGMRWNPKISHHLWVDNQSCGVQELLRGRVHAELTAAAQVGDAEFFLLKTPFYSLKPTEKNSETW